MTGGSGVASKRVARILAELVIHGPLRVEELQKRCDNMSKRTFYLALNEAEKSGLLTRNRKSRKNVLVQLNPKNSEIKEATGEYQRKFLALYYNPFAFHESLPAASSSSNRKQLEQLMFYQAGLLTNASVASLLLEGNLDRSTLQVQQEINNIVLQRHKQMMNESIKEYGGDAIAALEAWLAKHAKEIAHAKEVAPQVRAR